MNVSFSIFALLYDANPRPAITEHVSKNENRFYIKLQFKKIYACSSSLTRTLGNEIGLNVTKATRMDPTLWQLNIKKA